MLYTPAAAEVLTTQWAEKAAAARTALVELSILAAVVAAIITQARITQATAALLAAPASSSSVGDIKGGKLMSKKAIILLDTNSMAAGTVENLIEMTADSAVGFVLPTSKLLWDCGQYPVAIGDRWEDGVFSREGGALVPVPTDAERIAQLEAAFRESDRLKDAKIAALTDQGDFQEDLIVELAGVVYA